MLEKTLLSELAPYSPINREESGGCIFCGGTPPGYRFGKADRFLSDHTRTCPWVRARQEQGDVLPQSREAAFELLRAKLPLELTKKSELTLEDGALLSWLLHRGFAEASSTHWTPSAAGRQWLARPTGLRAVLTTAPHAGVATALLAGLVVEAPLRERGIPALPGLSVIARPHGQSSWALEPL